MKYFNKILVLINSEGKKNNIEYVVDFLHMHFKPLLDEGRMIISKTIDSNSTKFLSRDFSEKYADSLIIAVGGDGTMHEIVNTINFKNTTVALIPNGTGNDFAKHLYGSIDLEAICNKLLEPEFFMSDLIKVNEYYCMNTVSFGYDTNVLRKSLNLKKRFPFLRNASFKLAIPLTINQIKPVDYSYSFTSVAGVTRSSEGSYILSAICNGSRFGGGFIPAPNAKIDDGVIEVNQIDNLSLFDLMKKIGSYLDGTHIDKMKESHNTRVTSGKIIPKDNKIFGNIDGELYEFKEIVFSIQSKIIRLMK